MVTIQELLDEGILIDETLVQKGIDETLLQKAVDTYGDDLLIIDEELLQKLQDKKETTKNTEEHLINDQKPDSKVNIVWSYDQPSHKRTYNDFVKASQMRFKEIEKMLKTRQELQTTTSIGRIRAKQDREHISCVAMVLEKSETVNGNVMLTVEDMSGKIKALINQKKKELYELAQDIQLDEIIGITGNGAGEIIFVDNLLFPDVPLTKELKKAPVDEYAIFIGDPHFGSNVFLKEDFERMLLWLNGKSGNEEQKTIAKKVKYVFMTGDLIEGVGIYPGQENDLEIQDIREQYVEFARYLHMIPQDKEVIVFTGNHDAGRLSEPQEPLMKEYAAAVYDIPNVTVVSNPAVVNIAATKHFPGFDCLLYHGGSFIYYSDNIPSVRKAGGQKRVDLIMKYLLQRRHLAPTHNAALTIPTTDRDWLLIDRVPDFFISGHIHRVSVANYRNVTMINAGCWTETTEDQVKRGLEPQPSKLVLINLKTRGAKVMNFRKESSGPTPHDNNSQK